MKLDSMNFKTRFATRNAMYIPLKFHDNQIFYIFGRQDIQLHFGESYEAAPLLITSGDNRGYYDGFHGFVHQIDAEEYILETFGEDSDMKVCYCLAEPPFRLGKINNRDAIVSTCIEIKYDIEFERIKNQFLRALKIFIDKNAPNIIGNGCFYDNTPDKNEKFICKLLTEKFLETSTFLHKQPQGQTP